MSVNPDPAAALAKAITGEPGAEPSTRLDRLRCLAAMFRTSTVQAALPGDATSMAEAERLVVALEAFVLEAQAVLTAWEARAAGPPTAVAIIVQGGVVQEVCSAEALPHLRFEVVDYDVDSGDASEADLVRFEDGSTSPAWRCREVLSTSSDLDWTAFDADPA